MRPAPLVIACLAAATLAAQKPDPSATGVAGRIVVGQSVSGTLGPGDPLAEDSTHYDDWLFEGRVGQHLELRLSSDAFDTFLGIGDWNGTDISEIHEMDDDGGDGTNSRIVITLPYDGTYVIRANALRQGGLGPYTLEVRERPVERLPEAIPLVMGQSVPGALADDDPLLDDGSHYALYRFEAEAGQRIVIIMSSDDFDAFVAIGQLTGDAFEIEATDDDGSGGTDARLEFMIPTAGAWYIRATTFVGGSVGQYTLTLEPGGTGGGVRKN